MSFSLYGSLPPSKSEKKTKDATSSTTTKNLSKQSLYSSIPPPEKSQIVVKEVSTTEVAPSLPTAPASQGWSALNKFRPVLRRPTIQAKPKMNKPVIPAGATVVSIETVSKTKPEKVNHAPAKQETKTLDNIDLGSIPLLSTHDNVNGFRAIQKSRKKNKKKNANLPPQPIVFNMFEDYDPHRPNDYEQYKEERTELREKQKRQRDWEKRQMYRSSKRSLSRSRLRSPTPEEKSPRHHDSYNRPPSPIPAAANINLNETAEDVYQRRLRLSQQQHVEVPHPKVDDEKIASAQEIAKKVLSKYGWQEGQGKRKEKQLFCLYLCVV
ncbi:unnamed protein product [Rhizopus stolonifer]